MLRSTLRTILPILALSLLAVPALAQEDQTPELTLDEIIAKHLEARGGEEAWAEIDNAKLVGRMSMQGMDVPMTVYYQRPDKHRMDMEMQGMALVRAFDGESGWQIAPMLGSPEPQVMNEAELKMMRNQSEFFEGPLVDYAEKGNDVQLEGLEEVEGTEAYHLVLTNDEGDVSHRYLDAEYFLEFLQKRTIKDPTSGQEVEISLVSGDFKEVGGVLMPHSYEIRIPGAPQAQTITFDKIEVNTDEVDDALFAMPETQAPAEEPAGR